MCLYRTPPPPVLQISSCRFGPRHFASNQVYSPSLRASCRKVAARLGLAASLREGVYIQMGGPQFESVAELKMLKAIGVDAVGERVLSFAVVNQSSVSYYEGNLDANKLNLAHGVAYNTVHHHHHHQA